MAKPAPPPPTPRPASAPKAVTIPAGTALNLRMTDAIDVDASKAGQTFKAVVDDPVMTGGSVIIPRGTSAAVQAVQVATSYVEAKGKVPTLSHQAVKRS